MSNITSFTEVANSGVKFAREIGAKLKEYADLNYLCDEYEEFITLGFSDDVLTSTVYREFFDCAKRDPEKVERVFRVEINVTVSVDDFEYKNVLELSDTISADGTYLVPKGVEVNNLDDLDDLLIEHIGGTDLISWVWNANDMSVTVSAEEEDFTESLSCHTLPVLMEEQGEE